MPIIPADARLPHAAWISHNPRTEKAALCVVWGQQVPWLQGLSEVKALTALQLQLQLG